MFLQLTEGVVFCIIELAQSFFGIEHQNYTLLEQLWIEYMYSFLSSLLGLTWNSPQLGRNLRGITENLENNIIQNNKRDTNPTWSPSPSSFFLKMMPFLLKGIIVSKINFFIRYVPKQTTTHAPDSQNISPELNIKISSFRIIMQGT